MESQTTTRSRSALLGFGLVATLVFFVESGAWGRRSPTISLAGEYHATYREFAVAADHPVASEVGAQILNAGGNAADAAAATMLALGVANPASSGLGGGGFLTYYRASDQTVHFLDFREAAPAAATPDMFEDVEPPMPGPANAASQLGGLASGVPGEPAGIEAMVERFGNLELTQVIRPAARLAEQGVEANEGVARMSRYFGAQMKRDPVMASWFPEGAEEIPQGTVFRQPELARTLRALGSGSDAIYEGRIARAIVRANQSAGGVFTREDLASYEVIERAPLDEVRFGFRFVTAPPPSAGGFTMLQSLGVLERLPERWWSPSSDDAVYYHGLAESWKGPYLDRERYFGDPTHVSLPLDAMRAPERLDALANVFHPALALPAEYYDFPVMPVADVNQPEDHGTSHLCVVDAEGNVAAVTTTVNLPFGARYTAAGMVMNDEMDDFARAVGEANAFGLIGGAPNLPGPGKRPISSMSPTIVFERVPGEPATDEGAWRPVMCAGAAGGSRIITATQQVLMNALMRDMRVEDALSAPRVHHQAHPVELRTEEFAPITDDAESALRLRGHQIDPIRNVANVQTIRIRYDDGARLEAGSDPRKGGRPAGR